MDAEKGEGVDLAKTYNVHGYPTFILMNAQGEPLDRWIGYSTPATWNVSFNAAMADPTTVTEKEARFAANPTAKDASHLAEIAAASRDYAGAIALYDKAKKLDPKGDYTFPVFDAKSEMYITGKGGTATLDEVKQAASEAAASPAITIDDKVALAQQMRAVAHKAEDNQLMVPYLATAIAATEGPAGEPYKDARKSLMVDHALFVEKNKDKAVELKRANMPEGWQDDAGKLNAFAWWCFENNVNLAEAEELARKGVELAKPGTEKAQILDTVAEICNARGDCKDAVSLTEQAMKEDPKSDYYPKQLARFQKNVAAKQ